MFVEITQEKHNQLLEENELYLSIWNQIEYIEDYWSPFISAEEIYREFWILVEFGLETRKITERDFFMKVVDCLANITKLIEEKCKQYYHANLDLTESKSNKLIARLTTIINKFEAELGDVYGKSDFYGRVFPTIKRIGDSNPMFIHWNLVRLELAASIVMSTKKYYLNLIKTLQDNLKLNPKFKETNLLNIIIKSCKRIQGLSKAINQDEKSRTAIMSAFIDNFFIAKDESSWGVSQTSIKIGEPDIKIENNSGEVISILEGINLNHFDSTKIASHINKIFGYDANGSDFNFFVIFFSGKNFKKSWSTYKEKVRGINLVHSIIELKKVDSQKNKGNIKIIKSIHENSDTQMYHIYIKMKSQNEV